MASHLDDIVSLQAKLSSLKDAQEQIAGIPEWMTELHAEHSGRLNEISELEEAVEESRRIRREAESEIADAQEKLKRYQDQINQVTTQREYGALLQEIDTTKTLIRESEERAFGSMEGREEAEGKITEAREAFADLDQRYKDALVQWEAEKPTIAEKISRLEESAEVLRERVPRGLLAQFDRLRERLGGEALAPVQAVERSGPRIWHCGSCNYRVRPQVVVQIRAGGDLQQCDACKRILHLPPEEEP